VIAVALLAIGVRSGIFDFTSNVSGWQWMGFQPQRASDDGRINADLFPPSRFIATMMNFTVMPATQRDRELITDFAAECGALRGAQMMSIRGASTANKTWQLSDRSNVLPIADPTRRWERQDAFVNDSGCAPFFASHRTLGRGLDRRPINGVGYKVCQPRLESHLNARGISCR
jgi:hypothetical protein